MTQNIYTAGSQSRISLSSLTLSCLELFAVSFKIRARDARGPRPLLSGIADQHYGRWALLLGPQGHPSSSVALDIACMEYLAATYIRGPDCTGELRPNASDALGAPWQPASRSHSFIQRAAFLRALAESSSGISSPRSASSLRRLTINGT